MNTTTNLPHLLAEIRACTVCARDLPCGARPILAASKTARILIIGQAPGRRVHESGIAWQDPSGDRLREWMGLSEQDFYDESQVALVPMGFCYPGTGKNGDLPPRKECAELWHDQLIAQLEQVQLTLLIGQYAQRHVLNDQAQANLTATVKHWETYGPNRMPLPHPSPRNNRWIKQNPWFAAKVLPYLKQRVGRLLTD